MPWIHPHDEPTPRYGRCWSNDFNTYADACRFYGCDTPADIEAEMSARDAEEAAADAAFVGPRQPAQTGDIPF
jgi:hypothetical protein